MKSLMVTIGYTDYAVSPEDALALLGIAQRMRKLKRPNWSAPHEFDDENEPLMTSAAMVDVTESVPEPERPIEEIEAAPVPVSDDGPF